MDLDRAIGTRKSVRKFKDKKPDWRDIIEAIDAARHAPISGNNFTLKFILVDNRDSISKIAEASQQSFVNKTHYVVVAASNYSRLRSSFEEKGEIYGRQQAGAAIENFLLKLHEKGLSTCWIGHYTEQQIKKELKIPENEVIEAVFPIGYSNESIKPDKKIELANILFFNKHGTKKMKSPKEIDV